MPGFLGLFGSAFLSLPMDSIALVFSSFTVKAEKYVFL
jgi:hypothetical protein